MPLTTVVPLGGLGEIGLNALALESGGEAVLIDCGLLFPQEPGVEYAIPDFSWFREAGVSVLAVFLTHGHEDHVGALPHFLRDFPVPVYGSRMTLGLLERRLRTETPHARRLLHPVAPGALVEAGSFRAEFLAVTHSTAQACAVGVETPGGRVVHTGDFKLDSTPVDGKLTDTEGLARWGRRGVDLLCCESTNAAVPGKTPSERAVGAALRRLLPAVEGRAYVTTFASNVHRFQQVIEASRETGRSVTFLGRSVASAARVARQLGCIRPAPGDVVPEVRARGLPRRRQTFVVGGSQGEPAAALYRLAHGLDPHHALLPGDAVFFCSRNIPGNEVSIHRLLNACLRKGARVHYEEVSEVHVSGHAASDELAEMLALTRPRHLLPVHGELRHLTALARLAEGQGLQPGRIFLGENGRTLLVEGGQVRWGPRVRSGRTFIDSGEAVLAADPLLAERRRMGEEGIALATLALSRDGALLGPPHVLLRGVFPEPVCGERARAAEEAVRKVLEGLPSERLLDVLLVQEEVSSTLRRHFRRLSGRQPLVCATVLTADGSTPGEVDSARRAPLK